MWQSRVEIEGYSVVNLDCVAAFKAPYNWTSIKGRASSYVRMCFVDLLDMYACIYEARMSPALNVSSAIRCFKHSNAIEIHNGITFVFYMGLPHIRTQVSGDIVCTHPVKLVYSVTHLHTICLVRTVADLILSQCLKKLQMKLLWYV